MLKKFWESGRDLLNSKKLFKTENPKIYNFQLTLIIMKKEFTELIGMIIFITGTIFTANYLFNLTGYSVIDTFDKNISSGFGLLFIVTGLTIFILGINQEIPKENSINKEKAIKKIKIALITKTIGDYNKVKNLLKSADYNLIETQEYITIFSPKGKALTNKENYPIKISYEKRNNKENLKEVLKSVLKDIEKKD